MPNVEETIPAFSMWKMFNETIMPALLNMEYSENSLQKLASIVKTKEFLNIFVYNHDPTMSYEEYQAMSKKYKAFTVWLLGRFFYLLSCDKLAKMHELITDAQWRILHQICITQPHIYEELSAEYSSALKQLNDYHKTINNSQNNDSKIILQIFVPCEEEDLKGHLDLSPLPVEISSENSCNSMQQNIIKFVHKIIYQNIELFYFNTVTYDILDCLLYIFAECNVQLKLAVLDVYSDLLRRYQINDSDMPKQFVDKFNHFIDYIEPFVYDVYNKKVDIFSSELSKFENILTTVFNSIKNLENVGLRMQKIAIFIIFKDINESLQRACCEQICKIQTSVFQQENLVDNCIKSFIEKDNLLKIVERQIALEIRKHIYTNVINTELNLYNSDVSSTWSKLHGEIKNMLQKNKCNSKCCQFLTNLTRVCCILEMLVRIKIDIQNYVTMERNVSVLSLQFFSEAEILGHTLGLISNHMEACACPAATSDVNELLQKILTIYPATYWISDVEFIFHCIGYPFIRKPEILFQSSVYQNKEFTKLVKSFSMYVAKQDFSRENAIKCLCSFMRNISVGFIPVRNQNDKIEKLQNIYFKIVKSIMSDGSNNAISSKVLKAILYFPTIFNNRNIWINQILLPALEIDSDMLPIVVQAVSEMICKSCSQYIPVLSWNSEEQDVKDETFCLTCTKDVANTQEPLKLLLQKYGESKSCKSIPAAFGVFQPLNGNYDALDALLERVVMLFSHADQQLKIQIIKALKAFLHVKTFHTINVTKLWLKFANDDDKEVRMQFTNVIYSLLYGVQESTILSKDYKVEMLQVCFAELKIYTKKSLQYTDFDLQDTVLETLRQISFLMEESITLNISQLLLFFIMIPTSKYSLVASNIFIRMASLRDTTTNLVYSQYKKELSQSIVELCAINQGLINYNLSTSLEKISLILGFFGPKDFITQECRYLLPFFVSLIIKVPEVEKLIHEVATFVDMDISELLISRYGNIFLHLFLNESDEGFKKCMVYVEKNTGLSGNTLRKRNFQVILNELLLNFHEKQDRVILAVKILAREDAESQVLSSKQIPEYLQPRFLGVLAYFDMKLIARHSAKKKVLLSLAQLLRFMGPKHITPLRFKILAMLRTALNLNYETFPELNYDVWDAFVRSCEIEALGPQLASIFVSLLPLMEHFPTKIDDIFKYLIIENEVFVKDYIPDLFFVVKTNVNNELCVVIKKHLQRIENMSFKEQLKWFLKYLNHETIEIRIHALKYLKRLLEKNREELDQMILGYNGIDPTIVELLDVLMLGCREKEKSLKLACGECIGELGAIEPSHLPRQYTQEAKFFVFFITEDAFIVNALNELTRAFQAEKNTQNMDRFALAIQEMLKVHGISPDAKSPKHNLWVNFPEAQRELMLPLLSSRYTMVQPLEKIPVSPIYGTKFGATFQTWVYNWTCNLILAVNRDKQQLLQVCLPSLKQDHRTMMNFLPHILLHALLENDEIHQTAFNEFMAIINCFSNKTKLKPHVNVKPSSSSCSTSSSTQLVIVEELKENQCTKVIFILLDFLDRWTREWIWEKGASGNDNNKYQTIKTFLCQFCKFQLARCNYQCGEYPRALMYLEEFIKEQPNSLRDHFTFLTELYAQLDEPDGVAGVTALQDTEPPLEQRLLSLEVSGKLADATACYERIHPPLKPHHLQGLVQCYLDLDNVNTALNFTEGAIQKQPEYKNILFESQAEPLWRLSRYTELDTLLKKPELKNNNSWGVQMGRALLHLRSGERDEFKTVLDSMRLAQVESLGAASLEEGAYQHGYGYIAKLHSINELQQVESMVYELFACPNDHKVCESVVKRLTSEWKLRIKVVQESIRIQEPILCLRRVGIEQAKQLLENKVPNSLPLLNSLLGESWLLSATIARVAGVHQQAYTYTLKAEEYAPPELFLEKARLHWLREEHEQAFTTLRRGFELIVPEGITTPGSSYDKLTLENKKIAAKAKLLTASYNDSISNVDTDINLQHYKEAIDIFKEWEKSLVCLAQYYDRVFQMLSDADKDEKGGDIQIHMINYFARSLLWGTRFVYQSMPRLLSIWFDYGTQLLEVTEASIKAKRQETLLKMTKLIDSFSERLPTYIFLTAFSQLVSRICHPQKTVYIELKSIIIKLILQYPQQTLWMMMSVIKSSYSVRSKRCAEILNDSRLKTPTMIKLIGDFTRLAEKLIELCNKDIPDNVQTTTVSALLRVLPRMLTKEDFSEIMIPTQKFRKLVLPNPDFPSSQHNPFPNHYVHIVGIEDEITVLQSLQHPRKITFRGSDGNLYVQMLKPKDDLRRDFRLMEFNDIVNQLLSREADSRQRRLNIRLYSVVPLNEECGLIEWVPNLIGLRLVLAKIYKQLGMATRHRDIKQYYCNIRDTLLKKREMFTKGLLPRHPPVLGEWFRKTFPDAQGWLSARTAYIRTTAVISMVGYIVGLGDRHGENILFDSMCGDTMHVDFNCLFNKGESFEWPERVPFRLTHNMVAAMGPLGVEGVFRKSCACTLRVLRTHSTTLMSIVTPFVYDPLVSWHRSANASSAERTNEQALDHIRDIELRLQGVVRTKHRSLSIPLSVEGQTNILIQEATSIDNLCQMYSGWGPYL